MRSTARSTKEANSRISIGFGGGSWLRHQQHEAASCEWRIRERSSHSPLVPFPLVPVLRPLPPSQITCTPTCFFTLHSVPHRTLSAVLGLGIWVPSMLATKA